MKFKKRIILAEGEGFFHCIDYVYFNGGQQSRTTWFREGWCENEHQLEKEYQKMLLKNKLKRILK